MAQLRDTCQRCGGCRLCGEQETRSQHLGHSLSAHSRALSSSRPNLAYSVRDRGYLSPLVPSERSSSISGGLRKGEGPIHQTGFRGPTYTGGLGTQNAGGIGGGRDRCF